VEGTRSPRKGRKDEEEKKDLRKNNGARKTSCRFRGGLPIVEISIKYHQKAQGGRSKRRKISKKKEGSPVKIERDFSRKGGTPPSARKEWTKRKS